MKPITFIYGGGFPGHSNDLLVGSITLHTGEAGGTQMISAASLAVDGPSGDVWAMSGPRLRCEHERLIPHRQVYEVIVVPDVLDEPYRKLCADRSDEETTHEFDDFIEFAAAQPANAHTAVLAGQLGVPPMRYAIDVVLAALNDVWLACTAEQWSEGQWLVGDQLRQVIDALPWVASRVDPGVPASVSQATAKAHPVDHVLIHCVAAIADRHRSR